MTCSDLQHGRKVNRLQSISIGQHDSSNKEKSKLIFHADPEGYELHAKVVAGPVAVVD